MVGAMHTGYPDASYTGNLSIGAHKDFKSATFEFGDENNVSFLLQNSNHAMVNLFAQDSANPTWYPNAHDAQHLYLHDIPVTWTHSDLGACTFQTDPESALSVQLLTSSHQSQESHNFPHHLTPAPVTAPCTPWIPEVTAAAVETEYGAGVDTTRILLPPKSPLVPRRPPRLDTTSSGSVFASPRSSSEETQTVIHRCENCYNIFETQSALK
jgi:hypothetical protein